MIIAAACNDHNLHDLKGLGAQGSKTWRVLSALCVDAGLKDADQCITLPPDFIKGYALKVGTYCACCLSLLAVCCFYLHLARS